MAYNPFNLGRYNVTLPTLSDTNVAVIQLDAKGQQLFDLNYVLGALHSKTNPLFALIGDGTNNMGTMANFGSTPGAVYALNINASIFSGTAAISAANPLFFTLTTATSGGCSVSVQQALTTDAQVKGSAGQLYGGIVSNPNGTPIYLMYYNVTSIGTIGSATNLLFECMVQAGVTTPIPIPPQGIAFGTGIFVAVATTATGNTAPGTGVTVTTYYA